ncbi:MAG: nucleoside deaminase [Bdellovibrionales bacterium]|nr:nucleoside deaminase [Ramlibacter sp.]
MWHAKCFYLCVKETRTTGQVPTAPAELDESDAHYLQMAIGWARMARERGDRPFGAVIVSHEGRVLAEACCNTSESGDCTGHAELNAVRKVSPHISREVLTTATLYSSVEPCMMCAGAIFWSSIGRVVYGMDANMLREFRAGRHIELSPAVSCRDVFSASRHRIECIGPAMVEEASRVHAGYWK